MGTVKRRRRGRAEPDIRRRVVVPVRLADGTQVKATMVTFHNLRDDQEHLAVLMGDPQGTVPLVRIHSECLTGDLFGSLRCDCGLQLEEALRLLAEDGGVLLYLRQEGRGIGLYSKLDSYELQDAGFDTFEANRLLHFPDDPRDYGAAVDMLRALEITELRLLSNNPDKINHLAREHLVVTEVIATGVYASPYNHRYLAAKVRQAGNRLAQLTEHPNGSRRS